MSDWNRRDWVDAHAHAFELDTELAGDRRYTPSFPRPVGEYLAVLDANGVSAGVLVQPSFLGSDNSYVLRAIKRHPDRLRGVAVVPPDCAAEELTHLRRSGIVGLRLNLIESMGPWRLDPSFRRFCELAAETGLHIEIHARGNRLAELIEFILPTGANIVVDHMGRPGDGGLSDNGVRAVLAAGDSRRVYAKLSGPYRVPFADHPALAQALCSALGADRLMWGSDWPWTQHEDGQDYRNLMNLPLNWLVEEPGISWPCGATARALFGFPKGGS